MWVLTRECCECVPLFTRGQCVSPTQTCVSWVTGLPGAYLGTHRMRLFLLFRVFLLLCFDGACMKYLLYPWPVCKPDPDVCQLGYGFTSEPIACVDAARGDFILDDKGHCNCAKAMCKPGNLPHRCVAGRRRVSWENDCA